MIESRRHFLRSLGICAAPGAAGLRPVGEILAVYASDPARAEESDGFIHLDNNENAYGPSAKVAEAVRSTTGMVNRYPFRKYDEVTKQIASFHRVKPEQVLFACGSTEILRVAACAFLGSGRQLIQAVPTFEAIGDYAKSVGSEVVSVPLNRSFAHDTEAMLDRSSASTGLVYICNPNNPTSSLTPRSAIENFVSRLPATARVLVDEAYHHYVIPTGMYASFIDTPLNDERVIVTRTFSKVYGLAGLRLGYAVASAKTIEAMRKFLTEASLNAIIAQVAGVALEDVNGVKEFVRRNHNERQEFLNSSNARNLKPIDPHGNFVMINTQHPAEEVIAHFRKHKILIGRRFPTLNSYIRVSLGATTELLAFWKVWDLLPWSNKMMHH